VHNLAAVACEQGAARTQGHENDRDVMALEQARGECFGRAGATCQQRQFVFIELYPATVAKPRFKRCARPPGSAQIDVQKVG
jgi:hypothetical protein